jgi:hypothetical protein
MAWTKSLLMLQFNADALRLEPRLRTNQTDDRVSESNERGLPIGTHERSQRQAEDHVGAPAQRRIGVGFPACSGRVFWSSRPFDQPSHFGIEHDLPTGMMGEPWAQPVAMLLDERKILSCRAPGSKQRLAKERSDRPLAFIEFLGVDA